MRIDCLVGRTCATLRWAESGEAALLVPRAARSRAGRRANEIRAPPFFPELRTPSASHPPPGAASAPGAAAKPPPPRGAWCGQQLALPNLPRPSVPLLTSSSGYRTARTSSVQQWARPIPTYIPPARRPSPWKSLQCPACKRLVHCRLDWCCLFFHAAAPPAEGRSKRVEASTGMPWRMRIHPWRSVETKRCRAPTTQEAAAAGIIRS